VDDTSYPVFEFTVPRTGEKITKANSISGGNYRVGDQVDIIYDPNDPTNAQIKDFRSLMFLLLFTSVFAVCTAAGVLGLRGRIQVWTSTPAKERADLEELPPLTKLNYGALTNALRVDEKVVWSGKPPGFRFFWWGLAIVPFFVVMLVVFVYIAEGWSWSAYSIRFFLVGTCAFAVGIPLMMFGVYRYTDYMITDKRVITQIGLGVNALTSIEFNEIQDIQVKVGLVDRIFGTGIVTVIGAGSTIFMVRSIDRCISRIR
jgi:membrane protein YdbS with pleckstrin-like domain